MAIRASIFMVFLMTTSAGATVLKQEPPMGALKQEQVVFIDDGSCPRGQIRRLVGGNHLKAGGREFAKRISGCVPR